MYYYRKAVDRPGAVARRPPAGQRLPQGRRLLIRHHPPRDRHEAGRILH